MNWSRLFNLILYVLRLTEKRPRPNRWDEIKRKESEKRRKDKEDKKKVVKLYVA